MEGKVMNDSDLDELLSAVTAPLPATMLREAATLAAAAKPSRLQRGKPRPRWFIPVVVAGSLALTGAASVTAAQLSGWPWVKLPDSYLRSHQIPVDYVTDEGHVEKCGAYVELRNGDSADLAALNEAIDSRDWKGFGQRLYEQGSPVDDDADSESRVSNELYPVLVAMTKEAIPGALDLAESVGVPVGDSDGPVAIGAMGMSCRVDDK